MNHVPFSQTKAGSTSGKPRVSCLSTNVPLYSSFEILHVQQDRDSGVTTVAWPAKLSLVEFWDRVESFLKKKKFLPDKNSVVIIHRYGKAPKYRTLPGPESSMQPRRGFVSSVEAVDLTYLRMCTKYADFCYQRPILGEAGLPIVAIVSVRQTREILQYFWHDATLEKLISPAVFASCDALHSIPET